jgi:hypothetical protein
LSNLAFGLAIRLALGLAIDGDFAVGIAASRAANDRASGSADTS